MVPAKKILTVAYGAFSCTLEGFDDPVAAMTEIAAYFRDLAAQDRLFGAEPATPDMAQLRGIAERTGDQPVSARAGDVGIVLRRTSGEDGDEDREVDQNADDLMTAAQARPRGDDAIAAACGEDALSDAAGAGLSVPPEADDCRGLSDREDDTLAAELAASLSGVPANASGSSAESGETDGAEAAATAPVALPVRHVRGAGDAADAAASIVTPAAARARAEHPDETGLDAGEADQDILGRLSIHGEEDVRGARVEEAHILHGEETEGGTAAAGPGDDRADLRAAPRTVAPSAPDMERLFAATDSRLSGEATSRRIANISHLKAAVAARRADGPSGLDEDAPTDAYRADLASSVRSHRTVRPTDSSCPERPARPMPLMLVSEQRVCAPAEAEADPAAIVLPRRAPYPSHAEMAEPEASRHAAMDPDAEAFERFAADRGATDLPDILEAAAIYTARLTGQDVFTRPALLHLAAEACDDLSREDGLRGFGQLLRDGRIRKVGRGTFALGDKARGADRRTG